MHQTENRTILPQTGATVRTGEAWELLDRSTRDEETEIEASQDLDLMREDAAAHLTATICWHLLCNPDDEANTSVVLPHLCRCSCSRRSCQDAVFGTIRSF